jgi:hypothetical protein
MKLRPPLRELYIADSRDDSQPSSVDSAHQTHMSPHELEQRIQRLRESSETAAIELLFAELTVGITNCQLARKLESINMDASESLMRAEMALRLTEKYVWKFKMKHPEFDQMIALAERLRFELDSFRPTEKADEKQEREARKRRHEAYATLSVMQDFT